MPNLANAALPGTIDSEQRAIRAWVRIQRRPRSIVVIRKGVAQSAQTVRVELNNGGSVTNAAIGQVDTQGVIVYGVIGHPTVADTDIQEQDRAIIDGKTYTFETVISPPGELQAFGTVKSK